jgi:hypothetical protein
VADLRLSRSRREPSWWTLTEMSILITLKTGTDDFGSRLFESLGGCEAGARNGVQLRCAVNSGECAGEGNLHRVLSRVKMLFLNIGTDVRARSTQIAHVSKYLPRNARSRVPLPPSGYERRIVSFEHNGQSLGQTKRYGRLLHIHNLSKQR